MTKNIYLLLLLALPISVVAQEKKCQSCYYQGKEYSRGAVICMKSKQGSSDQATECKFNGSNYLWDNISSGPGCEINDEKSMQSNSEVSNANTTLCGCTYEGEVYSLGSIICMASIKINMFQKTECKVDENESFYWDTENAGPSCN